MEVFKIVLRLGLLAQEQRLQHYAKLLPHLVVLGDQLLVQPPITWAQVAAVLVQFTETVVMVVTI
jgi:hypothetical protein